MKQILNIKTIIHNNIKLSIGDIVSVNNNYFIVVSCTSCKNCAMYSHYDCNLIRYMTKYSCRELMGNNAVFKKIKQGV